MAYPHVLPAMRYQLCSHILYCATGSAVRATPVALTAARTTAILSVALEHRTKYHVAW